MKLLKQKILFLTFSREGLTTGQRLQKQSKYLSYNFFYNLLSEYKQASIRKAVKELTRSGGLDHIIRNRRVYLRLTTTGEKTIRELFPDFFSQQLKSEGWLLALPKKNRQNRVLRLVLLKYGFKNWQKGIYLQPAKNTWRKSLETISNEVLFVFSKKLEFTDEKQLAGQLWQVDRFYKKGQDFIKQAKKVLKRVALKNNLTIKDKKMVSALSFKFFIIISNTIRLPKNLLPDDWSLPQAAAIFSRILRKVE